MLYPQVTQRCPFVVSRSGFWATFLYLVRNVLFDLKLSLFPLWWLSLYLALFMFSEIFSFGQIQLRGFHVDVEGLNMKSWPGPLITLTYMPLRTRPDPCDSRGSDWFTDQPIDILLCMLINHADSPHFIWGFVPVLVSDQMPCLRWHGTKD